ncbi:hypothetical protein NSK_006632 [Nannochloropsis salina CCMP1776]|uniref:Protein-serine/threonine kinase n=1 Tax=Nannochloropsis salina CCMP1776 TaxID=1027361 RepID=A0A4D9CTR3_9STRA|nr:hypothetical protein NSK_006632 [Nannochloropsis salina CCMP1776]|eukprot:TFJ81964.1 hypothetical protein NSK_006632 [Nannochloropsis salina CCMP1776]
MLSTLRLCRRPATSSGTSYPSLLLLCNFFHGRPSHSTIIETGSRTLNATSFSRERGNLYPFTRQQSRHIVVFSAELGRRLGIDARRQAKPSRPSQLIVTAQCFLPLQGVVIQQLHRELRTRIGHQILRLQHVLPASKGVDNLLALHIDVYERLWALDDAIACLGSKDMKPVVIESFNHLMSEIEGRMAMVVETLMDGLKESYKRQAEGAPPPPGTDPITPIVTSQVDRFLQARIGIATLIRHYLDIIKSPGEQTFVPTTPVLNGGGGGKDGGAEGGDEEEAMTGMIPSPSSSAWHESPYVVNKRWGSVVENCRIKELIDDCRAEVEALCEHYYQERIPPVVIDEPPGAVATLIPAHFHHTLFEILKNAFKATVESAVRRNLNNMPAVKVRIFPGKEEVCVRIRDFGDGMSLRTMSNATEYLFTSAAETYEQQQQQMQQSYQPAMEPMQGMGIGLPVSRLYARHWGGDIRLISVQGWGTDVAIYLSRKDLPEAIPVRVFD